MLVISISTPASAALCADSTSVVERLDTMYAESLIVSEYMSNNILFEFYASANKTWTFTVTLIEEQLTCVIKTGTGMEDLYLFLKSLSTET